MLRSVSLRSAENGSFHERFSVSEEGARALRAAENDSLRERCSALTGARGRTHDPSSGAAAPVDDTADDGSDVSDQ